MLIRVYDCLYQCYHVQRICQTAFYPWSLMHVNHIHWCHQQTSSHAGLPSPTSSASCSFSSSLAAAMQALLGEGCSTDTCIKRKQNEIIPRSNSELFMFQVFNIFWLQEHHLVFVYPGHLQVQQGMLDFPSTDRYAATPGHQIFVGVIVGIHRLPLKGVRFGEWLEPTCKSV